MYVDASEVQALHDHAVVKRVQAKPTLVIVKAVWCHYCKEIAGDIQRLRAALKNTGMNMMVIELDAFNATDAKSNNAVVAEMHRQKVASTGVPYIGMAIPQGEKHDLHNFPGKRDAISMAHFVLNTLKENPRKSAIVQPCLIRRDTKAT